MNTGKSTFVDEMINGFKKGIGEIEELRVQIALGKAEAKDLYEQVKKNFNEEMDEAKKSFRKMMSGPDLLKVMGALELLRTQLSLGIAETEALFETQKKAISNAIHELDTRVKRQTGNDPYNEIFRLQLEKFRIKLELLSLHYKLKNVGAQFEFELKKTEFLEKLGMLENKMNKGKAELNQKFEHFHVELTEAYTHFKKAFRV